MSNPLRRPRPSWRTYAIVAVVLAGLGASGYLFWRARWHISRRAIEMADPTVRGWARDEVARLSHGAYHLSASTIRVDEAHRSVSVDTIVITTDSLKAVAADNPLPILSLRFIHCALTGIDLTRLAAGRGLHIGKAGCEAVTTTANLATMRAATDSTRGDSTSFLTLTRDVRLPRQIPTIDIDRVAFPTVALGLDMQSSTGRRTSLSLDRLAVWLDTLHYDPDQPTRKRRTLLSRHALVTLEHFRGSQEEASRLEVDLLSLDLSRQSIVLDGFNYEPLPGQRTDSLGFAALDVRHLRVGGVDWRALLTTGDLRVGLVRVDSALVSLTPRRVAVQHGMAYPPQTLETTLRAIDRVVRLDSLVAHDLTMATKGERGRGGATLSVKELLLARIDFGPDNAAWASAFPVGRVTMQATGVVRQDGLDRLDVARLALDIPAQRFVAEGFRMGPSGSEADFRRRSRYAHDRVVFTFDSLLLLGVDFREYLRRASYQVRRADVAGFGLDVLTEDELPREPGRGGLHEMPQAALRRLGIDYRLDTIIVAGRVALREREKGATEPGTLTFDRLRAQFLNVTNDPTRMSDSTPLRVTIDARLMQAGTVHITGSMPLLAPDFRMRYQAEIGTMPAAALNPFLVNATGMKFQSGELISIRINSTVSNGRARGTIEPRWRGLHVELPGVARTDRGLFGGIKRGLAKFAANAFAVRDDNITTPTQPALNAVIDHRWSPREALPGFIWLSLREPLLPLLKH